MHDAARRSRPFLFLTAEEIEQVKGRVRDYVWARAVYEALMAGADGYLRKDMEIPERGGGWWHWYACPKHGVRLEMLGPHEHRCPVDGEILSGWPYDDLYVARVHGENGKAIRDLGLAYTFTGNRAYAEKAKEILCGYADRYLTYEMHEVRREGRSMQPSAGKMHPQTLDEAVALIPVAWGYDLIYDSGVLSEQEKTRIEQSYLRPVVGVILRHDAGKSNWQSWHNAAIGVLGCCLEDEALIRYAVHGRSGFHFQMAESVLEDGFWYEGAMSYHFYTLTALLHLSEAMYRFGLDLYADPRYRSLFDAPLEYAFPDMTLPALHDSHVMPLAGQASKYEVAYARWGDPKYLTVLSRTERRSREALFWGKEALGEATDWVPTSVHFTGLGLGVLRRGSAGKANDLSGIYLSMDYGPHGGGHGHPDKLSIVLYGLGRELAPDPGCIAYGNPLHRSWYKQTVSHNTVVVDEVSQQEAEGICDVFYDGEEAEILRAHVDTAYEGVRMDRTLVCQRDYVLDVFKVSSPEPHVYDWCYHNRGTVQTDLSVEEHVEPLSEAPGYATLRNVRRVRSSGSWTLRWDLGDGTWVRWWMIETGETKVYLADGPGNPPTETVPMVLARRRARETVFVSCIELGRGAPALEGFERIPVQMAGQAMPLDQAVAVEIRRSARRDQVMVSFVPGTKVAFGGHASEQAVAFAGWEAERIRGAYGVQ